MAANGSSGRGGQNPWRRPQDEGPPDLIELLKKLIYKTTQKTSRPQLSLSNHTHFRRFGLIIALFLLLIWVLSGIYLVNPAEQAVILRFGQYMKTVGPGPHWLPRFIESSQKVNVQRIKSFPYQAQMLSQDENIVSVKVQVQYRIDNPKNYLFNVVDPEITLQQAVSSALRQMVGQMNLDPLITTGRQELTIHVIDQLKHILSEYQLGIAIVDVALQEVKPPTAVTPAFDDVIKAREDKQSYINKANAYAKNRVLLARGVSARLQQEAEAYAYVSVAKAKGETARYLALLKPFQQAPDVTSERLYLDTMAFILSKTKNIITNGNNLIYLSPNQLSNSHPFPATAIKVASTQSNQDNSETKVTENNNTNSANNTLDSLDRNEFDDANLDNTENHDNSMSIDLNENPSKSTYPERPSYLHGESRHAS